jgi:hypothetical protein
MDHTIRAGIEFGDHHQGNFQIPFGQHRLVSQVKQQPHKMLERRGPMGKDFDLVQERPVGGSKTLIDGAHFLRDFVYLYVTHACHTSLLFSSDATRVARLSRALRRTRIEDTA